MLGTLNPSLKQTTVIGGGAAGLLATWHLLQAGHAVTLYEAGPRLGGLIDTTQTPWGPAEKAAHSFRSGPAIMALCRHLGITLCSAQHKAKFIYRHGRLRKIPLTVPEFLVLFVRALLVPASKPASLADFGHRHMGRGATDALLTPLAQGIYATPPKNLCHPLAFPRLAMPRGRTLAGHFLRGMFRRLRHPSIPSSMHAPEEGMQALVSTLAHAITSHPRATVKLNHPVIHLPDDTTTNIILATPAHVSARLLATAAPATARALNAVTYAPLCAVTAFMAGTGPAAAWPQGIGVLAAADTKLGATGVLFNSSALANRLSAKSTAARAGSFTFMYTGAMAAKLSASPSRLRQQVRQDAQKLFGPTIRLCAVYPSCWKKGLPVYNQTLQQTLGTASQGWCAVPGHILFGNYTGDISLRGMAEAASRLAASQ